MKGKEILLGGREMMKLFLRLKGREKKTIYIRVVYMYMYRWECTDVM